MGIYYSYDSFMYIGQWDQNCLHGEGLLVIPFGAYLFGEFRNNRIHGVGILKIPYNKLIVGNWKNG